MNAIETACAKVIARTQLYRRLGCDPHWANVLTLELAATEAADLLTERAA